MDALERQEESIIESLLTASLDCQRRIDADPAAVLGVTVANVAAAA